MATFVRLSAKLPAINMDHVALVEWAGEDEEKVAITFHDGRVRILSGGEARRMVVWVQAQGGLPVLQQEGRV